MPKTSGQKPRKGWIYMINPNRFILRCKAGHDTKYEHQEIMEIECSHPSCRLRINPSHVIRGMHPYVIWSRNEFSDRYSKIKTFTVLPLTSSSSYVGLPTVSPLNPNQRNGLEKKSFVLIHQIVTIDYSCFKDLEANTWIKRIGQLSKQDKDDIQARLSFYLDMDYDGEDWFLNKIDSSLREKIILQLSQEERYNIAEKILDSD